MPKYLYEVHFEELARASENGEATFYTVLDVVDPENKKNFRKAAMNVIARISKKCNHPYYWILNKHNDIENHVKLVRRLK